MRTWLSLLPLTILAACDAISPELQSVLDAQQAKIGELTRKIEELDKKLADSVTLVSCTQDIQQLFEQVRSECSRAGFCSTPQIRAADGQLDPERRHGFFKHIRANFIHEVFYISPNQRAITVGVRRERMAKFVGIPLFRNTRLLVIASDHISPEDAHARAKVVTDDLVSMNFPIGRIDVWPYNFKVPSKNELAMFRGIDLPQFGEAAFPLGVWVFRVDCSLSQP